MRQTLIITVKGPQRTIDIEVPGNVPVSDLLPLFLEMCGDAEESEPPTASSVLSIVGMGKQLVSTLTLSANQVLDGDVLLLTKSGRAIVPVASQEVSRTVIPGADTGMIGVTWIKEGLF